MRQKLGQHFLKSEKTLCFIAENIPITKGGVVIEIGPGHGELTRFLLEMVKQMDARLYCIEKDTAFFDNLEVLLDTKSGKNKLFKGDVREILPNIHKTEGLERYEIAGNIPYYLTSFLFRIISQLAVKPNTTTLLIQKEVAIRASQKPPKQNLLSAITSSFADAKILKSVPRGQFNPPPDVDSAIIQLVTHKRYNTNEIEMMIELSKILFEQPRKTIFNNLRAGVFDKTKIEKTLQLLDIPQNTRAQNIASETIMELAKMLYNEK